MFFNSSHNTKTGYRSIDYRQWSYCKKTTTKWKYSQY